MQLSNSKTRWSREGQRHVMACQMRKHHWCLCASLIVGSFESGNDVAVRFLEMFQWKLNQRRKQLTNELAMHKHLISVSQSLTLKWSISPNCLQRQQLGLQRLSGFINSCVNENKLPMCEQSDGKQHPVLFCFFLSALLKQHMFYLRPWCQYGTEGKPVSIQMTRNWACYSTGRNASWNEVRLVDSPPSLGSSQLYSHMPTSAPDFYLDTSVSSLQMTLQSVI